MRLLLPGAFARLAPSLADRLAAFSEQAIEFHPFVASGLLANAIRSGEPADLYVSANWRYARELHAARLIHAPRQFAGNRLCIVTPETSSLNILRIADLVRPDVHLLLPQAETDPCGQYTRRTFLRAGLERVLAMKEARGEVGRAPGSARLIEQMLADGYDAGVLYRSEAIAIPGIRIVELPLSLDLHEAIAFVVAPVGDPEVPHPAAETLAAWFTGNAGQGFWVQSGFLPSIWTT